MGSIQEQKLIDELLDDLERDRLILPTLPEVALKVRDTLEDESMGLPEVARVITSDAALSARLIQITNSPLLRSSREIETVEAAVLFEKQGIEVHRATDDGSLGQHGTVIDPEVRQELDFETARERRR